MKAVRMMIGVAGPVAQPVGRIDSSRVNATTEEDLMRHQAQEEAIEMLDATKFPRRVRRRIGSSQAEFAQLVDVSLDIISRPCEIHPAAQTASP